jgi:ATP phosphoribosyltransferase
MLKLQNEVDSQKETLIEKIEARMKQSIQKDNLFTIMWKLN